MRKCLIAFLAIAAGMIAGSAYADVDSRTSTINSAEDNQLYATSYYGARGKRTYLNPATTQTATAFTVVATGAETVSVLASNTTEYELGINSLPSATTGAYLNFASGNASNGTGIRIAPGETYKSPPVEVGATGTSLYISSTFGAISVWVATKTERFTIPPR